MYDWKKALSSAAIAASTYLGSMDSSLPSTSSGSSYSVPSISSSYKVPERIALSADRSFGKGIYTQIGNKLEEYVATSRASYKVPRFSGDYAKSKGPANPFADMSGSAGAVRGFISGILTGGRA